MFLLAASLLALALGPGLVSLSKNRPRLLEGLDGFVVATITGIVALHVVPHALAELGARAGIPLALGLVLPWWLERPRRKPSRVFAVDVLLVVGLTLHALVDGVALNTHEGHAHGGHNYTAAKCLPSRSRCIASPKVSRFGGSLPRSEALVEEPLRSSSLEPRAAPDTS